MSATGGVCMFSVVCPFGDKSLTSKLRFFHVNRFRRWWLNLHVLSSFYRTLAGFSAVNVVMKIQGVMQKLKGIASLPAQVVASGIGLANQPVENIGNDDQQSKKDSKVITAIRQAMDIFHLATASVVGSDGYRIKNRHAGQAYTICWGPPFVFTTPNLADTRNGTLLILQGEGDGNDDTRIALDKEAPELVEYRELRLRLVHDPVGQAILFELLITLFYLHVLGVRADCVAHPRGSYEPPEEHFTDGVAASVTVHGAYGPLVAARGEVEASGRGSLHPHILCWALCDILRDKLKELGKNKDQLKELLREWIRAWITAANSMHHSSVAHFPTLFHDNAPRGDLPRYTEEMARRTKLDGGVDNLEGCRSSGVRVCVCVSVCVRA